MCKEICDWLSRGNDLERKGRSYEGFAALGTISISKQAAQGKAPLELRLSSTAAEASWSSGFSANAQSGRLPDDYVWIGTLLALIPDLVTVLTGGAGSGRNRCRRSASVVLNRDCETRSERSGRLSILGEILHHKIACTGRRAPLNRVLGRMTEDKFLEIDVTHGGTVRSDVRCIGNRV